MKTRRTWGRNVALFEDFSDALYVVELSTDESERSRIYVFRDEADQESMYDELLKKNPNIADSRRFVLFDLSANAEIDVPEAIQRAWDDEVAMTNDDLDRAYAQLDRVDREKVDARAVELAEKRGVLAAHGDDRYRYYDVVMYVDSMEDMLERVEAMYRTWGRAELDRRFANLDWLSKEDLARVRRESKTRGLFGV
jgi:hypothetical protein